MRTQLSKFCTHFDRAVRPMLAPLQRSTEALGEAEQGTPGTSLRTELADLCHELESLLDKVAGQQAYVLIFGPLKSGKSTLMNAISKTYVSEVSSLPAYPCLVFVSHGEKREYVATEYGGRTRSYPDAKPLQDRIRTAHRELADRMRKTELSGAQFDPKEHFPSAIRRIDVKLPAANLAETGVVLVDTPGLYTRMRFGYDRMTREFRNMAACAVFVVKSDNLFLEQVFSEFHRLLELFSRVFLVVNMDTHKRDLGPDGALHPSLEQRAPERIIEAFESLAMSAPLAQATAEGRIRIYPVDLMNSASAVLRKDAEIPQSFVRFRDDLEQYLASTECLADFLGDSLRRAHSLSLEAGHLTDTEEAAALRDSVADLEARCNSCRGELDRIETCLRRQWKRAFARFAHELEREVQRRSHDQGAKLARVMDAAIDTWFMSNYSLDWLIAEEWAAMVQDFREDVLRTAQQCFEHSCSLELAGLDLEPADVSLLGSLGIDLRELRWAAHAQLGATAAQRCLTMPSRSQDPSQQVEPKLNRGQADRAAIADEDPAFVQGRSPAPGGGEMDEADGLVRRGAAGPRDPGHRHGRVGRRAIERARRHRLGDLRADRTMRLDELGGHTEQVAFRLVRVGHEAALDHIGGARNLGQAARYQPAGARLRGRDLQARPPVVAEQGFGLRKQAAGKGHGSGSRSDAPKASAPA